MKFDMLENYEYTYNLCAKYCLYITDYKMFRRVEIFKLFMTDEFNTNKINIDFFSFPKKYKNVC